MNKSLISCIFGLVAGAGGGYIIAKVHYDKKLNDEIELVVHNYKMEMAAQKEKERKQIDAETTIIFTKSEEDMTKAKDIVKDAVSSFGYFPDATDINEEKEDDMMSKPKQRIVRYISPSELDDGGTDYETIRYTWNKDGSLKREDYDDPITDIDEMIDEIGVDFRDKFKDPKVNTVYIRDDSLEYDYVIERNLLNDW